MKTNLKKLLIATSLVALVAFGAACGNKEEDKKASGENTAVVSESGAKVEEKTSTEPVVEVSGETEVSGEPEVSGEVSGD